MGKALEQERETAISAGKPTVSVSFAPGHDRYGPDCNAFHEAGYDAYITGCVFAHLATQALCPDLMPALNGRCTMWRSLYNFNLSGDDELVTKGIHVHARGLKGHDVKFVQDAF